MTVSVAVDEARKADVPMMSELLQREQTPVFELGPQGPKRTSPAWPGGENSWPREKSVAPPIGHATVPDSGEP